ncbi:MAG: hypothetical protein KGQ89_08345 [Verrucomicrobia bacterium]|nr:hypothetical protein [Verrucomicrobiota bacterium]
MTSHLIFSWFAVAVIFSANGCHQNGYELNRQSLELAADKRSVSFNLRDIVDTHEVGLWSAEQNVASGLFAQLDVGRATISTTTTDGNWSFSPLNSDDYKGFGETLTGNVPLGYINGSGSGTLTIPLKPKRTIDQTTLNRIKAVIFVSPRQSGP